MPTPNEIYSILGFINTWKLYHKYIILYYLKVWNVGWFSYHMGFIVNMDNNDNRDGDDKNRDTMGQQDNGG